MRTDIHARRGRSRGGDADKNATSHPRNPFLAPDTPLNRNLHGRSRRTPASLRTTTAGEQRKENQTGMKKGRPVRSPQRGGNGGREVIP